MMTAARGSRGEELLSMGAESRSKEGGGSTKAGIEMEPPKLGFPPDCAMKNELLHMYVQDRGRLPQQSPG